MLQNNSPKHYAIAKHRTRVTREYSPLSYNDLLELGSRADVFFESASRSQCKRYIIAWSLGTCILHIEILENSNPKHYTITRDRAWLTRVIVDKTPYYITTSFWNWV